MKSEDVVLRPAKEADRAARQSLGMSKEIERMFGGSEPSDRAMTQEEAELWFTTLGTEGSVERVIDNTSRFLGSTRLHLFRTEPKRMLLTYCLVNQYSIGKGIGPRVTRRVL